jgi:dTDP-4-amino-4,6-dideoxygalactose transaminase
VFSFHPVKTIAMGEGGAVTTNDPKLYERMMRFRSHGMTRLPADFRNTDLAFGSDGEPNPWYYEMPEIGFNYRASDIHCALALSQLGKLDRFIERRRVLAELYDRLLKPLAPIVLPPRPSPACTAALHLYSVQIDFLALGLPRETVMRQLKNAGIGTQVHYIPVHTQPYYRERSGDLQLQGAMAYYRATLSLPLFASMDDNDVRRVVASLEECVASARTRSGR